VILDWLHRMSKKRAQEREEIVTQIGKIRDRHDAAARRLEKLTSIEIARRESLLLQAEVMSRSSSRRG